MLLPRPACCPICPARLPVWDGGAWRAVGGWPCRLTRLLNQRRAP